MFPGIDGFHWTFGHILFLSLFFAVALTILMTVVSAVWRTARDFRTHRAIEIVLEVGLCGVAGDGTPLPPRTCGQSDFQNL